MNFNFIWVDIDCPKCGYIDSVQMIDISTEKLIFCHNCKVPIEIHDENASAHKVVLEGNKLLNKLDELFNFKK